PNKSDSRCQTCGHTLLQCTGHWGYMDLQAPVYHVGYFKYVLQILYCICKTCAALLQPPEQKEKLLLRIRRHQSDPIVKRLLFKRTVEACKKVSKCFECGAPQGVLKRVVKPSLDQFMKIRHVVKSKEGRAMTVEDDLDPLYVKNLLERIRPSECEILDIVSPEKLLLSRLLVPPSCIRPSVTIGEQGTTEDDLTCVLSDIAELNNVLQSHVKAGFHTNQFLGIWEFLQLQCTRLINADAPAVSQLLASKNISKPGRGICQRLKGKEGRFRGNLSGKRVDFSGRTVISPDPNANVYEVVVPEWVAKRLTFPERVNRVNIEVLRAAVLKGCSDWPGACYVNKVDGSKCSLRYANRRQVAENLQIGDVVERHLCNGDVVLFNRQPSLHRMSIMAHRARVMPWRTFRFNECVCSPYNADFDGDEMNLHLPQTHEARAEALYLMGVVNNLVTPKNGEPLIAATQDFLSSSYMLTHKDVFLTRDQFCLICSYFTDGLSRVDLPPPTILKPVELWTGKQVISVLLRPNRNSFVMVNFQLKEREFSAARIPPGEAPFMCPSDAYVIFRHSELVAGCIGKKVLGDAKFGLFFHLIRDNSPAQAAACMGRIAKLSARWFANRGMTIGIDDVTPSPTLLAAKKDILNHGYNLVAQEIQMYKKGALQPHPGCTLEQTLEVRVKSILDDLRNEAGKACNRVLHPLNKPLIMFNSGAKGALINIAQMIACVGQQNVSGQRIQNGFVSRTLPHFPLNCRDAKSRGFVASSFYSGLQPDEFFFHTMSGREGLVDTAVKTAETGYMQRRLMKALEDLSIRYDNSVRTSDGQIVQFVYGDDGLNPAMMEDKNQSMCLDKVFQHISSLLHIKPLHVLPPSSPLCAPASSPAAPNWPEVARDKILPPDSDEVLTALLQRYQQMDIRLVEASQRQASGNVEPPRAVYEIFSRLGASDGGHGKEKRAREDWAKLMKLPRSYRQKLAILLQTAASGNASTSRFCQQVRGNLLAHVAVYEWLPIREQHVPLLPFEILKWSAFLLTRTAEVVPLPLCEHQQVALEEAPTHQSGTERVRLFQDELWAWLERKAADVAEYRESDREKPGLTQDSYDSLLACWRRQGFGIERRQWIVPDCETALQARGVKTKSEAEDPSAAGDEETDMVSRDTWQTPDISRSFPEFEGHEKGLAPTPGCPGSSSGCRNGDLGLPERKWKFSKHQWVTVRHILEFLRCSWRKYVKAISEAGEAVGAMGAQSIGEPGTQMTLKTFHFAGVASMNVTLGVPRIKEIINAAQKIQTPIIVVPLVNDEDYNYAVMVKNRIEKTLLSECCSYIKEVYAPDGAWLVVKLDQHTIRKLFLDINANTVKDAILRQTAVNKVRITKNSVEIINEWKVRVMPPGGNQIFFQLQALKLGLLNIVLCGHKDVKRGVIKCEQVEQPDKTKKTVYGLAVEGYGLRDVMGTQGVKALQATSNHVMEVAQILGIEAARAVIISEIRKCMDAYSMDIDCRHMTLLGDVMTFRGEVLGINRFGIQKMRASTLMLASFEETNEHLFEAAVHHRADPVKGVSECIIMGKQVSLGTGSFDLLLSQSGAPLASDYGGVLSAYGLPEKHTV
ncbi:DNA-directed RNA polymerase III RPC1, partial [Toxoplasma gondii TgCatPRC2]